MSTLINDTFKRCREAGRAAFVAYITAGDPNFEDSLKIAFEVVNAGADILELGVPFSDPMADGEANQLAAVRALESGMNTTKVLALAAEIRKVHPKIPLVLFTYINPVAFAGDFKQFCKNAVKSGVNAMLPLDMPPEESGDFIKDATNAGIDIVRLIAPTTDIERMKVLLDEASGFIYYVCREGVTGERTEFAHGVTEKISQIKSISDLPVAAGFGISTPEHVKAAAASGADGVVVGSAIVRKVEAFSKRNGSISDIGAFVSTLTSALRL